MGIKNLNTVIKEYAPEAIHVVTNGDLHDKTIAVDASISIYQWCAVGQHRKIVNARGKYINHIQGAFFRTVSLLTAGAKPVFIFDGPPPPAKANVLAVRRVARDNGGVRVPREVYSEVEKLLTMMGVSVLKAPAEAEAQAATMTPAPADMVATEDTDAVAHGATLMLRGLSTSAKNMTLLDTAAVLEKLSLTREEFIDMCILLGCDYTRTIPGIGYKRAVKLIQKYHSIEAILAGEKITPPDDFDYNAAREEFLNPRIDPAPQDIAPKKLTPADISALGKFLIDAHGLEPKKIEKSLNALHDYYLKIKN